ERRCCLDRALSSAHTTSADRTIRRRRTCRAYTRPRTVARVAGVAVMDAAAPDERRCRASTPAGTSGSGPATVAPPPPGAKRPCPAGAVYLGVISVTLHLV